MDCSPSGPQFIGFTIFESGSILFMGLVLVMLLTAFWAFCWPVYVKAWDLSLHWARVVIAHAADHWRPRTSLSRYTLRELRDEIERREGGAGALVYQHGRPAIWIGKKVE